MSDTESEKSIDMSGYENWHFYPYKQASEYSPETPLYSFVGRVGSKGDIMIYSRTPKNGVFHSVDPHHPEETPYPPTEELETAFALLVTNPGEELDISNLISGMKPWEHHFLASVIQIVDTYPDKLPPEIWEFINQCLDSQLRFDIEAESVADPHVDLVEKMDEIPSSLAQLRN